ncbi:Oxidoreductase, partial [Massospora cicadina]
GIDCVDKFREMQQCFKQFPDIYADELKDTANPIEDSSEDESNIDSDKIEVLEKDSIGDSEPE